MNIILRDRGNIWMKSYLIETKGTNTVLFFVNDSDRFGKTGRAAIAALVFASIQVVATRLIGVEYRR